MRLSRIVGPVALTRWKNSRIFCSEEDGCPEIPGRNFLCLFLRLCFFSVAPHVFLRVRNGDDRPALRRGPCMRPVVGRTFVRIFASSGKPCPCPHSPGAGRLHPVEGVSAACGEADSTNDFLPGASASRRLPYGMRMYLCVWIEMFHFGCALTYSTVCAITLSKRLHSGCR